MNKPTLFHPDDFRAILKRVEAMRPNSQRLWGKMTIDQMLAHCCIPIEQGLGILNLPKEGTMISRWVIKQFVLRANQFQPNMPTAKPFVIRETNGFEAEKARLTANLLELSRRGVRGPWAPHNLFGVLKPEAWGRLTYVHLDHHLRQFSG